MNCNMHRKQKYNQILNWWKRFYAHFMQKVILGAQAPGVFQ